MELGQFEEIAVLGAARGKMRPPSQLEPPSHKFVFYHWRVPREYECSNVHHNVEVAIVSASVSFLIKFPASPGRGLTSALSSSCSLQHWQVELLEI